ncbi:MAG: peptidoglycan editing factor PgeF [Spirulinaceae cyanobacterium]
MLNEKVSGWQWQTWQGLPYLTCDLLQQWQHGFFTQQFCPQLPEEIVAVFDPQYQAYRVKQVHGSRVMTPWEIEAAQQEGSLIAENGYPPADAIFTDQPQQAVFVASADCTPVLIGDLKSNKVAAIHAGWRGTAKRIVPEAIARFVASGSNLEDLRIAMGPAIAGEVYQVSEKVATEVGASVVDSPEAILTTLLQLPNSPILPDTHPNRVKLDVRRINALQLEGLGINQEQVVIAPHCTYQQPEYFFSYRRSKEKKVQWSGIASMKNGFESRDSKPLPQHK